MARVTIDDCIKLIPNRFQLTLAATYRARQLTLGSTPQVEAGRDKPTVIALREIAAGKVGVDILTRNQSEGGALYIWNFNTSSYASVASTTSASWKRWAWNCP